MVLSLSFPPLCRLYFRCRIGSCIRIYWITQRKKGGSIMADWGFTISSQLSPHGITLNLPPLMEGWAQLPAEQVKRGCKVASFRVDRVIGNAILKGTLPLSMSRISYQVIHVCACLVNFQPIVTLPPSDQLDNVDLYFATFSSEDSEYDADTEHRDHDNDCWTKAFNSVLNLYNITMNTITITLTHELW